MLIVVLLLLLCSLVAGLVSLAVPARAGAAITVVSGLASFGLVLAVAGTAAHRDIAYLPYLRIDALSVIFMLATGFLYAALAVYSVGYVTEETGHEDPADAHRYARRFYAGLNLFCWAMLAAPMMNSLALLWIAIEITTVVSALLVALEGTDGSAEAAWKYVLIASAGLGLALLATIFAYVAGAQVLGGRYDLALPPLLHAGAALPHTPVRLAFMLAVLGYGTKMGLFPVHTWLPDAHSEAPTPVSALLSASLLADSFYAILRYYQVTAAAVGSGFPREVLLAFGVASLLLAALQVLQQPNLKRLLAYSSIEHMGILAIGVSFGAPAALAGVMLHVLAHAAAKGNAFMGAGVFTVKFGSKQISAHRGALDLLPWSGPLFLAAVLALSAMPPFGIFRSEFQIVAGGLGSGRYAATAVLIILVTVAFSGLTASASRTLLQPPQALRPARPAAAGTDAGSAAADGTIPPGPAASEEGSPATDGPGGRAVVAVLDRPAAAAGRVLARGEPSAWMVVPAVAGMIALLVLGLHPPAELTGLMARAAAQLGGVA